MNKTIYKYTLVPGQTMIYSVPGGGVPLYVAEQHGEITIWIEVDPKLQDRELELTVYGTGWDIPEDHLYVGTAQVEGYVWHVYRTRGMNDLVQGVRGIL